MADVPIEIHVIADSTGDTAARVARAAQAQFDSHPTAILRHPRITTAAGLRRVFEHIQPDEERRIAVFSTLVDDSLRGLITELCDGLGVPHVDLIGPAIASLEQVSGDRAQRVPARAVGVDPDYFKRIAAMEFAVKHDDGQFTEELGKSEIVLIGVSRSGKTPLSMYLGYLGYKTANIPLVAGIAPPQALFEVDRHRIVALTIDPQRLATIRERRTRAIGHTGGRDGYARLNQIYDELEAAHVLYRRLGAPVLDTSTLALEEAAGRIIELIEDRRRVAEAARVTAE